MLVLNDVLLPTLFNVVNLLQAYTCFIPNNIVDSIEQSEL